MSARSQRVRRTTSTKLPSTLDQSGTVWLINHAKENLWKVHRWMDLDDLIHDGYLCFALVVKKYPKIKSVAHRFSLFKSTFENYIKNVARAKRYRRGEFNFSMFDDEAVAQIENTTPCEYAELLKWFSEADGLAKLALSAIMNHPKEFRRKRRKRKGKPESLNDLLCRLTGQDPKTVDLHGALKASVKT
jgi:hypothetical protein